MTVKANSRDAVSGVFLGLDILRKHHKANGMLLAVIETADKVAEVRAAELKLDDRA